MYDHTCRFCRTGFKDKELENSLCDDCRVEIKKTVISDPKLNLEITESIISNPDVMQRIAKALSETPIRQFGLGGEGTFAEFFRKPRKASVQ